MNLWQERRFRSRGLKYYIMNESRSEPFPWNVYSGSPTSNHVSNFVFSYQLDHLFRSNSRITRLIISLSSLSSSKLPVSHPRSQSQKFTASLKTQVHQSSRIAYGPEKVDHVGFTTGFSTVVMVLALETKFGLPTPTFISPSTPTFPVSLEVSSRLVTAGGIQPAGGLGYPAPLSTSSGRRTG